MIPVRVLGIGGGRGLAALVAKNLSCGLERYELSHFPDGELYPGVEDLAGDDVYVIGSTDPPVQEHLIELLLTLDACQRAGAGRLTAVVPYFGYARQDQNRQGRPLGAGVAVRAIAAAGAQRLVVVDPHGRGFETTCSLATSVLSAMPILAAALHQMDPAPEVVVAPDLGATRLADEIGRALELPVAIVRKRRLDGSTVEASELIGEVRARHAVIVDDMISTGATIEAASSLLVRNGADQGAVVAASHGVFVGDAAAHIERAQVRQLLVTDSCAGNAPSQASVVSIAPLIALEIERLHRQRRW